MDTLGLTIYDIFGEQQSYYLSLMREKDRVTIWAGKEITINMNLVTFMTEDENEITFHFINQTKLVIRKTGEVLYVTSDSVPVKIRPEM